MPELSRHETVDLLLRQHARDLEADFLRFVRLARECIAGSYWARFGYDGPARYFEDRVGLSYRSLARRFAVLDAIDRLPESERPAAEIALAEIGSHKAGVLARVVGREGQDWRGWVKEARSMTEPALQDLVSAATGAAPRGPASEPGERWYQHLVRGLPPEAVEEVQEVFDYARRLGMQNPIAIFLCMIREVKVEWSHLLASHSR